MGRELLERLAKETYERLENAERFSVSQSEETITEINLLNIAMADTASILVEKTNKYQESTSGVDWEWWVRDQNGLIRRLAVQAKKLSTYGTYLRLDHENRHGLQADLLEAYAKANGCEAYYCLYNYPLQAPEPSDWHCCEQFDEDQFGCTLIPAVVLRPLIGVTPGFQDVHSDPSALPWRCLYCHSSFADDAISQVSPVRDKFSGEDGAPPAAPEASHEQREYTNLPQFLLSVMNSRRARKFTKEDLSADFYQPEVGLPKRILVSGSVEGPEVA